MGGLLSTSYDVQKVGQNVKGASRKRTSSIHEIKTTESGNNVFAKSDIEIIGPLNEPEGGRKDDGKTVRIDETITEVFEHEEVRQEPPPPEISPEERKRQEDLMMAMVRGEIHPRDSVSEDAIVIVKTIGSITALETQAQGNCSGSIDEENLSTPEESAEKAEDQDTLHEVVQVQVNNVLDDLPPESSPVPELAGESTDSQSTLEVTPVANTRGEDSNLEVTPVEDLKCAKEESSGSECVKNEENHVNPDAKLSNLEHLDLPTEIKLNVVADINLKVMEEPLNAITKPTETEVKKEDGSSTENQANVEVPLNITGDEIQKDESVISEIQMVEEKARKIKEKIINFSGTSKTKEYEELYQGLATSILKLDDLSCTSSESDNERRRVIKVLKQCMENLERKIETVRNVESDSE